MPNLWRGKYPLRGKHATRAVISPVDDNRGGGNNGGGGSGDDGGQGGSHDGGRPRDGCDGRQGRQGDTCAGCSGEDIIVRRFVTPTRLAAACAHRDPGAERARVNYRRIIVLQSNYIAYYMHILPSGKPEDTLTKDVGHDAQLLSVGSRERMRGFHDRTSLPF